MMHNVVFNTGTNPVAGIAYNFAANAPKFWHAYDHNREAGIHVFLFGPKERRDIDLGHGGMVSGLWNDSKYDLLINGNQIMQKIDVSTVTNYFIQGKINKGIKQNEKQ